MVFLVGTQTGLHLVINGAQRFVPGLSIANVDGGWRSLTLKGVNYKMPGVDVTAGEFHLSLDLSCFRHTELCINAVRAKDVNVVVNTKEMSPSTAPEPASSQPLTNLSTPYPIILKLLTLNNVNVAIDDRNISLAEFRTGMEWRERALTLKPTNISGLLIALPKTPLHPLPPVVQAAQDKAVATVKEKVTGQPAEAPKPEVAEPHWAIRLKRCLPNRCCLICQTSSYRWTSPCSSLPARICILLAITIC